TDSRSRCLIPAVHRGQPRALADRMRIDVMHPGTVPAVAAWTNHPRARELLAILRRGHARDPKRPDAGSVVRVAVLREAKQLRVPLNDAPCRAGVMDIAANDRTARMLDPGARQLVRVEKVGRCVSRLSANDPPFSVPLHDGRIGESAIEQLALELPSNRGRNR